MGFDCIVIGGGPAGLTAAIYLGRFRRKVMVIDAGDSRALKIPTSHNYPGFADGIAGRDLLRVLTAQAEQYGAEIKRGTASGLTRDGDGFRIALDGSEVAAARVLLATGLKDKSPDMPGLREAVAQATVRYCPVCDGYEATDQAIAVYGPLKDAEAKALFLRTYSKSVTVLPTEAGAGSDAELKDAGIALAPSPPLSFELRDDGIEAVLHDRQRLRFDVLYPVLGCEVRSDLAAALGARCNEVGCLEVDAHQQTTVPGLYAAGDVVSDLHQLAVGAGHAGIAATAIHNSLPRNFR